MLGVLVSLMAPARAGAAVRPSQPAPTPAAVAPIDVIEVKGRIDGIVADFIERSLTAAERAGSQLLIVQLDSPGAVLSGDRYDDLVAKVQASAVPVAVWVGPSGSTAKGGAIRLVRAAAVSGIANGADLGRVRGRCPECRAEDRRRSLSATAAGAAKAVDYVTPTLGDFIVRLHGVEVGGNTLQTAEEVERDGQRRQQPIAQVRFAKLDLVGRVLHATTNPWIAYMLLVVGLLLILFEFYSVGIGVAGLTGAVTIALASYGLAALGATPLGLILIALAVFGYAVDVQAGVPRAWTVIGTISLVIGSIVLFPAGRRVWWFPLVVVVAGTLVFILRGMTTMVRGRFSTAVIARDSMVGESGAVEAPLDTEGTVRVRGALWRARRRGTGRMEAGTGVRVVAIDGVVLEVEEDHGPPDERRSQAG